MKIAVVFRSVVQIPGGAISPYRRKRVASQESEIRLQELAGDIRGNIPPRHASPCILFILDEQTLYRDRQLFHLLIL